MVTTIAVDDLPSLAIGAGILGTGGSTYPYLELINVQKLYRAGHRVELVHPVLQDRREQVLAGRETPVEGSFPDSGGPGHVFHGRFGSRLREYGLGRGEDRVMVPLRVGTHQLGGRKAHAISLADKWTIRPHAATLEADETSG